MKKTELVFIPAPAIGHLVSAVEFAKLLVDRDDRFSVTLLIMKLPAELPVLTDYVQSLSTSIFGRIRIVHLPQLDFSKLVSSSNPSLSSSAAYFFYTCMENQKPLVRDAVKQLPRTESTQFVGFVVDMLCSSMIDVGNEFGVPSYIFFPSGAAFLGLMLHFQALHGHQAVDITEFGDSDADLLVPSFTNSVPAQVLPFMVVDKEGASTVFLNRTRRFREMKRILVNTFIELESHAINTIANGTTPPVYPLGPTLNLKLGDNHNHISFDLDHMMKWLDDQPPSSVVFLCFGSIGSFCVEQVKEIAHGLEHSGFCFLWSLRQPPPKGKIALPSDYANPEEVLPKGFLDRTNKIGKVIGWAPQVAILAHLAIGGFVSHCGWNSILESLWHGVPIATWPMYSEQQLNILQEKCETMTLYFMTLSKSVIIEGYIMTLIRSVIVVYLP